jgi:hypothetical protein
MMLCEYTLQRIEAADPRYADHLPLCKEAADLVEAGKLTLDELDHDHPRTGHFKIEGQYLAGEDFERVPYPTWAEANAAFHQMRLARIQGTLPPVKSQRIVPTATATA